MSKLTFIDLFAGCGGLSEGFLQTGKYEALAHVEWEMPMISILRNRLINLENLELQLITWSGFHFGGFTNLN